MTSNRLLYLFILGLAAMMLAACNSRLAGQATEVPTVEQATPVAETEAGEEEMSAPDNLSSGSEAGQADSAAAADETASHLTEEGLVATTPSGKSLQPQLEQANIDMNNVVRLLPPDAIRAVNPEELPDIMVTAAEANEAGLSPNTRVIGVSINGESHAYPIPFLSRHEIINTELGGRLIAATW
jgi:hypothetical protein